MQRMLLVQRVRVTARVGGVRDQVICDHGPPDQGVGALDRIKSSDPLIVPLIEVVRNPVPRLRPP